MVESVNYRNIEEKEADTHGNCNDGRLVKGREKEYGRG